ncbi:MAG: tetratricopeptide repeat protein [Magnetococcales bacterium]|nr:tetratricopeptide repeat protein [Magnetococcales bacterium]
MSEQSIITSLTQGPRRAILRMFGAVARFFLNWLVRMKQANPGLEVNELINYIALIVRLLEGHSAPPRSTPPPPVARPPERPKPKETPQPLAIPPLVEEGTALLRAGQPDEALHRILAHPSAATHAELLNLTGLCHARLDRPDLAKAAWEKALVINPNFAKAGFHLGQALLERNLPADAVPALRRAVAIRPDYVEAHCQLGRALLMLERPDEAEASFRRALAIDPQHGESGYGLGNALKARGRSTEAAERYRQVLQGAPDHVGACCNLGVVLLDQGGLHEAEAQFRRALAIEPEYAEAWNNLGIVQHERGLLEEAVLSYQHALAVKPDHAEACNNLAAVFMDQGLPQEAEASYRRALSIQPDLADTRFNLGLLYLSLGRYAEGWPLYEARHHASKRERVPSPIEVGFPMWNGEEVGGKSLLIIPEQGFGDQVQFARFAGALKARGAKAVTLACSPPLETLFATLEGVDRIHAQTPGHPYPEHDCWTFSLSIPRHLGTTLETIPNRLPYLRAAGERSAAMNLPEGMRVGLAWKGNPGYSNDANRSLPGLAALAPLWRVAGVTFVSLQKGPGAEEAAQPPAGQPLFDAADGMRDFADTAGLVAQLDLVITIDSAVAHLAGAMAKPCWVLLPALGTDWRWLRDQREDSPWYPGVMRLFRQTRPNDWPEVIERVARALGELAKG